MHKYTIKRGFTKDLESRVTLELKNCFGVHPEKTEEGYRLAYGALRRLDVKLSPDGKSIIIDTESDLLAADDIILETNHRFRRYLDVITGFSTKERLKRAKEI